LYEGANGLYKRALEESIDKSEKIIALNFVQPMHTQAKGGTDWSRAAAVKGGNRKSGRESTDFKGKKRLGKTQGEPGQIGCKPWKEV
jgi:hypothetical protein